MRKSTKSLFWWLDRALPILFCLFFFQCCFFDNKEHPYYIPTHFGSTSKTSVIFICMYVYFFQINLMSTHITRNSILSLLIYKAKLIDSVPLSSSSHVLAIMFFAQLRFYSLRIIHILLYIYKYIALVLLQ